MRIRSPLNIFASGSSSGGIDDEAHEAEVAPLCDLAGRLLHPDGHRVGRGRHRAAPLATRALEGLVVKRAPALFNWLPKAEEHAGRPLTASCDPLRAKRRVGVVRNEDFGDQVSALVAGDQGVSEIRGGVSDFARRSR